jgi:hypothetical protein
MKGLLHGTYGTKVISTPLFLDLYPGAKVAYSFRKLRRDYRGFCCHVQNDDGATFDVPFLGDYMDVELVKGFLKNSLRGYVTKLYDQSGNDNTAILTGAQIPGGASIFTDGQINYRNGRVVINKVGVNSQGYYAFSSFSAVTDWSTFVTYKRNATNVDGWYFSSTSRGVIAGGQYRDNNVYHQVVRNTGVGNGTSRSIADNNNTYNLFSSYYQISPLLAETWKRGSKYNLSAGAGFNPNDLNFNTIGAYNSTTSAVSAELSEAILYTKYMGHVGPAMNENIMQFYEIEHFK